MSIRIIVCAKQVPDPEGPATSFSVDQQERRVTVTGLPPVISPFDENALEAALQIKEQVGASITLLGLGKSHARAVLLKAMATGADGAFLVEGQDLDHQTLDPSQTAFLLAAAIRSIGEYDLILTGMQAADTNAGQTGPGIAELLGVPCVTLARKIEVSDYRLTIETVLPDGYQVVATDLPSVVTVSHEVGELRYPNLAAIKEAKKLPVTVVSPEELQAGKPEPLVRGVAIAAPSRERSCRIFQDDDPEEAARELARSMVEDGVI